MTNFYFPSAYGLTRYLEGRRNSIRIKIYRLVGSTLIKLVINRLTPLQETPFLYNIFTTHKIKSTFTLHHSLMFL